MSRSDKAAVAQTAALGYGVTGALENEAGGGSVFSMFPLLTLSFLLYTVLAFTVGIEWATSEMLSINMISGSVWSISGGDLFLLLSFIFLFIEVVRSTGTGTDSIVNHVFSSLLFILCFFCFLVVPAFGTSTFFLMTVMTLMDMLAGFVVTIRSARRDFGVG